jgi:toxin YoeB
VVEPWAILFSKKAQSDAKKLSSAGLRGKAERLIGILEVDPFQSPPPFKRLIGDLSGFFSRRINIQHRLVYLILTDTRTVKIIGMFGHYGD